MAKKGGAQQLQAEINTDEDLHKFLEKPGILVLDVYSEWCGPCVAMVGSLRKIKLELGGDNLHLAVCKSDTIEAFARFRNKSEPTWLFATQGKLVNLMFGSDVPKLMQIITNELSELGSPKHTFYEITEMQPEECARRDVIEKAKAEAHLMEVKEAERQRREYLTHVTNVIIANLPDIGVTIFGPHIQRDTYKKLMETAENQKISCKDRRTAPLFSEHFEVINFSCENPIDPEIRDHMYNKDLLVGFWKISEQDTRPLEQIFLAYAKDLTQPREITTDDGDIETFPPILAPLEITVTKKIQIEVKKEEPPPEDEQFDDPLAEILPEGPLPREENEEDKECEESNENEEENEPEKEPEEAPESVCHETLTHTIQVPSVWVPTDRRTHATLIYVFFRSQTSAFLPPDPIPEPPHVVIAYDAYKKKEIFEEIAKHQEDVLQFGFFTDDIPETAQLIANTLVKYELRPPQTTDKLVLKVAKQNSSTMLAFANFGPSYISPNTVVGKEEALKFFPEGYTTREEEIEETEGEIKKKKKGKKAASAPDQAPTEEAASIPEETPEPA